LAPLKRTEEVEEIKRIVGLEMQTLFPLLFVVLYALKDKDVDGEAGEAENLTMRVQ
jgi:hypothetical protein